MATVTITERSLARTPSSIAICVRIDPSAVDRDEGEFRRHEPGVGDDEGHSGRLAVQ